MSISTFGIEFAMNTNLGYRKLGRICRLCLETVLVCFVFARSGACQAIDELTAQGKSVLKDWDFTPPIASFLEDKADKGDAKSQYVLGWMYFIGQSVAKSDEKAVQWMTKAANQNFPHAQTQLGLMCLVAKDIPGNYVLARERFLKGAARNETDALNGLGVIYSQGLGVEPNGSEAIKYFRQAADAGFAVAQCNLGYQYATGTLVPKDPQEAVKWFNLQHGRITSEQATLWASCTETAKE
jgi:hypothetical protein